MAKFLISPRNYFGKKAKYSCNNGKADFAVKKNRGRIVLIIMLLLSSPVLSFAQSITSFSPMSGPAGTAVTITGSGFNTTAASNIVYFGPVKASVTYASATMLIVTVPSGAVYDAISVTNLSNGLTAYSNDPFTVTFKGGGYITATSFASKVNFAINKASANSARLGDIDGDGKTDIIAGSYSSGISVLRNTCVNGSITAASFAAPVNITAIGIGFMEIADINGDGKLDIVGAYGNARVYIFKNTSTSGSISFASPVYYSINCSIEPLRAIKVSDLDSDGKPDIIAAGTGGYVCCYMRNTSTGGNISFAAKTDLSAGAWYLTAADLDGDRKPEIITSSGKIYRNTSTAGSISFAPAYNSGISTGGDIVLMDLDGDGDKDILSNSAETFYVFENRSSTGNINFSYLNSFYIPVGLYAYYCMANDIDGDGKPDIASVTSGSGINIHRNTNTPGAISASSFSSYLALSSLFVSAFPNIASGDLDNDGKPEFITIDYTNNSAAVYKNRLLTYPLDLTPSSGSINQPQSLTLRWRRSQEASGYHLQVGTDNTFAGGIVSEQTSLTDTFKLISGLNPLTTYYWRVKAKNATDASLFTDVQSFTTGTSAPAITAVTPSCTYAGSTVTITGTGFNTTAANNIVSFGGVRGTVASASGTSLTVTVPAGADYGPVTVLDRTTGLSGKSPLPFTLSFSGGGYITSSAFPVKNDFIADIITLGPGLELRDLNLDGKPDFITMGNNSIVILQNISAAGNTSADARFQFSLANTPGHFSVCDLNGDGKHDLVYLFSELSGPISNNAVARIGVLRNINTGGSLGTSSFAAAVNYTVSSIVQSNYLVSKIRAGDIDDDGKADLVAFGSSLFSVIRNNSAAGSFTSSSFEANVDFSTNGLSPVDMEICDIDGDNRNDLVFINNNNTVSVYRNTAARGVIDAGTFAARADFAAAGNQSRLFTGDIDGDGKPDLVIISTNSNSISVMRNTSTTGNISFASKVDFTTGSAPQEASLGDIDGDGKIDIAVANYNSKTVSLFRNTGSPGSITAASLAAKADISTIVIYNGNVQGAPSALKITDADGDGKPDIAVRAGFSYLSLFRNTILARPAITSPANNETIVQPSVTLQWNQVADASAYHVHVSTDETFCSGIIADESELAATSLTISGLLPNTRYYCHVCASNAGGTGPNSDQFSFVTSEALPVELVSFTAKANERGVELNWQTAAEVNNYGFEVERSSAEGSGPGAEGRTWEKIGFVKGNGNSNSPKDYSFTDDSVPADDPHYRLKQIDADGSYKYYGTIAEVKFSIKEFKEKQLPKEYSLSQNYPNPFNPVTSIRYSIPVSHASYNNEGTGLSLVKLKVYDIIGNEVAELVNEAKEPGYYEARFDAVGLSSGIYIYKLTAGSFSSAKKLVLLR